MHKRPVDSPDLNPIENVWRITKSGIKARRHFSSTLKEFHVALQEEQDKLVLKDWSGLIDEMPERIKELKEKRGMQTQY